VFSLVVDDFGIKYKHQADAEHLLLVLQKIFTITIDWSGAKYCGMHLKFDKTKRSVTLSMPGYVTNATQWFTSIDSPAAHSPAVFIPLCHPGPIDDLSALSSPDVEQLSSQTKNYSATSSSLSRWSYLYC
jgi:hypothetical protein